MKRYKVFVQIMESTLEQGRQSIWKEDACKWMDDKEMAFNLAHTLSIVGHSIMKVRKEQMTKGE